MNRLILPTGKGDSLVAIEQLAHSAVQRHNQGMEAGNECHVLADSEATQ